MFFSHKKGYLSLSLSILVTKSIASYNLVSMDQVQLHLDIQEWKIVSIFNMKDLIAESHPIFLLG